MSTSIFWGTLNLFISVAVSSEFRHIFKEGVEFTDFDFFGNNGRLKKELVIPFIIAKKSDATLCISMRKKMVVESSKQRVEDVAGPSTAPSSSWEKASTGVQFG